MSQEAWRRRFAEVDERYQIVKDALPAGYGEIPGMPVGTTFKDRRDCFERNMHRHPVQGIFGDPASGACSIVLSDGYEDDVDEGDTIIYTGAGGQQDVFNQPGPQTRDQTFDDRSNQIMQTSVNKHPVRVIRGSRGNPRYSPSEGYRYDGLYKVVEAKQEEGKNGRQICRFKLERIRGQLPLPTN